MWAVGCILAEMLLKRPLLPAMSEEDQINMITKLLGNPSKKFLGSITNEQNREFMEQMPKRAGKDFEELFEGVNPLAVDLLKKIFVYDPAERITVADAMAHPYLSDVRCEDDEPVTTPVCSFDFEFEKFALTKNDYKKLMWDEIMLYHS